MIEPAAPPNASAPEATPRRREIRLLLTTIAVAVGMLLLLARFRFPEESRAPSDTVQAPLERLAARATYDELAAIMNDLQRRIVPGIEVLRIQPDRTAGGFVPAARLTPDRAVVMLSPDEHVVAGTTAAAPLIVGRDAVRDLAVVAVAPKAEIVAPRTGPLRPGPRYVAVAEATQHGVVVRPVYVGRTDLLQDPRINAPLLTAVALQQTISRGAALFALDGGFIGLATELGGAVSIVPAENLRVLAEQAQQAPAVPGDLGLDVQSLTAALARASGADRGVIVNYVHPRGPAAALLTTGDVIRAIDGIGVTTVGGFQQVESTRSPGKTVALDIVRNGKPMQIAVRAVDAGALRASAAGGDPGTTVRTVPRVGLEIVAIAPGTAAAQAELQPGDIIVAIDGRLETDDGALARIFRDRPGGSAVLLTIRRGANHRVVALEKP